MSKAARLLVAAVLVMAQVDPAVCAAIVGQERHGQWADAVALPRGAHVRIADDSGRIIKGQVQSATDEEIVIAGGGAGLVLPRARVRRVELRTGRATGPGAARGFLVGLAIGTGLGCLASSNRGVWIPLLAVGWGGIGAAVGAASGRISWHYELVYQSAR